MIASRCLRSVFLNFSHLNPSVLSPHCSFVATNWLYTSGQSAPSSPPFWDDAGGRCWESAPRERRSATRGLFGADGMLPRADWAPGEEPGGGPAAGFWSPG